MVEASSHETILAGTDLGGPLAADPTRCSARVIELLGHAAGKGMRITSLAMDVTANTLGERDVHVIVRVDKRSRSIVFVSAEARAGDDLLFTAQGLFSRIV